MLLTIIPLASTAVVGAITVYCPAAPVAPVAPAAPVAPVTPAEPVLPVAGLSSGS